MSRKYEEPRVMQELHAIRVKHYEATKHMTPEERARSTNEAAYKIADKYGMKLKIAERP